MTDYGGEVILTRHPDGMTIDHADDHIRISKELIDQGDPKFMQIDGDRVMLIGTNRTVVYRLTGRYMDRYYTAQRVDRPTDGDH